MKLLEMRIADLLPAEYNPREITEEALSGLQKSVERFGLVQPIIWNQRTNRVVGGHQRLKVLQKRGDEKTSVVVVDLSEDEERALNVALNNPHIGGRFTKSLESLLDGIRFKTPELTADLNLDILNKSLFPSLAKGGAKHTSTICRKALLRFRAQAICG